VRDSSTIFFQEVYQICVLLMTNYFECALPEWEHNQAIIFFTITIKSASADGHFKIIQKHSEILNLTELL
jgi:hypothetical protein